MSLIDNQSLVLKCLSGTPVFLDDICAIYPVTLKQIADKGYDNFLAYLHLLTSKKPSVQDNAELAQAIEQLTELQFFLVSTQLDPAFASKVKQAFFFFTREKITFSLQPAQIVFGPLDQKHIMNEESFLEFQKLLSKMYFLNSEDLDDLEIRPQDSQRVKILKQQMKRNRQNLAKAKRKDNYSGSSGLNFSDLIASLPFGNCGLNILNIWDITYYAFQDQFKRMGWQEEFDINNRAALAGAKLKKNQLKHWIRSINDNK